MTVQQTPLCVLITGATGRIGRVVVEDLLSRGYRVRAVTSREPPLNPPPAVEWRQADFTASPDFTDLATGCDAVIHLAAEIGKKSRMERVNVEATRGLVAAAEAAGVRAFCYTSTVSVYGSGRSRVMDEDAPVLTLDRDVPSEYLAMDYVRTYGRTKLGGERVIQSLARSVPYVIFRPTVVVDVDQLIDTRLWPRLKRILAAHRQAHHIYVRDVSDALIWGMERALSGAPPAGSVETYNLSDDQHPSPRIADFFRKARAASCDARYSRFVAPGVFDLLHDVLRFRQLPLRRPLWAMQFPSDRLRSAGYRLRYGMAHAETEAIRKLESESRPGVS